MTSHISRECWSLTSLFATMKSVCKGARIKSIAENCRWMSGMVEGSQNAGTGLFWHICLLFLSLQIPRWTKHAHCNKWHQNNFSWHQNLHQLFKKIGVNICEFARLRRSRKPNDNYNICPFISIVFHFLKIAQYCTISEFHSFFLRLSSVEFHIEAIFCLFSFLLVAMKVISIFWLFWKKCCYKHWC